MRLLSTAGLRSRFLLILVLPKIGIQQASHRVHIVFLALPVQPVFRLLIDVLDLIVLDQLVAFLNSRVSVRIRVKVLAR